MPATFLDFDLRIVKHGPDSYEVTAETRTEGRAGPEPLDWVRLSAPELQEKLRRLQEEPYILRRTDFRDVGSQLFAALFRGEVLRLFTGIWDQQVQKRPDTYLRLRLDIDERAPEVAVLPWELLYWRDVHLATQIKTLITRQLLDLDYGAIGPLAITERPSVLIIIPTGSGLDTDAERQAITLALTQAGLAFDVLEGEVTLLRLADRLAERVYPILHFIGHGDFEEDAEGAWHGLLRFNAADGEEDWVDQERLQALLSAYAATTRLIVLNACLGGVIGERRAMQPGRGFVGLAPALLRSGIPAVVAMQYKIGDSIAIQFAKSFYQRLTTGRWAGYVDAAASLARNDCFLTDTRDRGFGTSVLYLRAADGHLFDLAHPIAASEANATPAEPLTPALSRPAEGGSDPARQQGKYNIHIGSAQGLVIGDQAQVTQVFGGAVPSGPGQGGAPGQQPPTGDAAKRHLQQQLVELRAKYDTLSRRIAALDTDIGRELDSERRWALQERRQGLMTEREQAATKIAGIERQLGQ